MANPQIEDGHLKIADDLLLALMLRSFTIRQMRIILAIMFLTYRAGKKESKISVHDIRYLTSLRSTVIAKDLQQLVEWSVVTLRKTVDGGMILGIKKDFEAWSSPPYSDKEAEKLHKLNVTLKGRYIINSNLSGDAQVVQTKSPAEQLLAEFQSRLDLVLSIPVWRVERARAKQLYASALLRFNQPEEAYNSILDCLEYCDSENFRASVRYPVSYVAKTYPEWIKQIPSKPRDVREQEELLGKRFKYDLKTKRWVIA